MSKTDITLVLDASGSMRLLREEVIESINEFIKKQQEVKGKCRITFHTFNSGYTTVFLDEKIKSAPKLTKESYRPNGLTALYDAVGKAVSTTQRRVKDSKAKKVIFVIVSDGMENASQEYNQQMVKKLIASHENWEFIYLASNLNAKEVAEDLSIPRANSMSIDPGKEGTKMSYAGLGETVSAYRSGASDNVSWRQEDYDKQNVKQ